MYLGIKFGFKEEKNKLSEVFLFRWRMIGHSINQLLVYFNISKLFITYDVEQ